MDNCKLPQQTNGNISIRIAGHSLVAMVVLSSLDSLYKNAIWKNNNYTISSVHLMGAAVDDEEVSNNWRDILDDLTRAFSTRG
jgi:hypothetical protein